MPGMRKRQGYEQLRRELLEARKAGLGPGSKEYKRLSHELLHQRGLNQILRARMKMRQLAGHEMSLVSKLERGISSRLPGIKTRQDALERELSEFMENMEKRHDMNRQDRDNQEFSKSSELYPKAYEICKAMREITLERIEAAKAAAAALEKISEATKGLMLEKILNCGDERLQSAAKNLILYEARLEQLAGRLGPEQRKARKYGGIEAFLSRELDLVRDTYSFSFNGLCKAIAGMRSLN